jgi:hypothetical protein
VERDFPGFAGGLELSHEIQGAVEQDPGDREVGVGDQVVDEARCGGAVSRQAAAATT